VHELGGRTVFLLPLFHPAAALRTPAMKETLRDDFGLLPGLLSGPGPAAALDDEEEIEEAPVPGPPQPADEQLDLFG
jgi:uracil-DNA glycosylase